MFSDHLRKFDEVPYKTLLWVAAGLVLLCQLVAVALVADAQVAKAKIREYQRTVEIRAIAQCVEETRAGSARHRCVQQARIMASSSLPPADGGSTPEAQALADASGESRSVTASNGAGATVSSMLPAQPAQGFMGASFAVR